MMRGLFFALPHRLIILNTNNYKERVLARTNYSYEKRQREIAKKKKKEEKQLRKQEKQPESAEMPDTPVNKED